MSNFSLQILIVWLNEIMKKLLNYKTAVLAAAVVFIAVMFTGCMGKEKSVTKTALKLDTVVTITVYGESDSKYIDSAFAEIDRLSAILDVNDTCSDIYRLSENAGEWIEVSVETYELLYMAQEFYTVSDGYFDVTAAPLIELWDVNGGGYLPTESEIEAAAALVNGADLQLDGNMARLAKSGMKADLGGIAKGYIADKVKEHLLSIGVKHAVIDLGGNIMLVGTKIDGSNYRVGVKNPLDKDGELLCVIEGSDETMVSSGIYERYFEHEGVKYHHIIDPYTGAPSESDLAGVTIISKNSARADALSTACLLMGREEALRLIEETPDTEAILVTRSGEVYKTAGIEKRMK